MMLAEYNRIKAEAAAKGYCVEICTVIEDLPSSPLAWLAELLPGVRPEPEPELEAG